MEKKKVWEGDGKRDWIQSTGWQVEVDGFGESDESSDRQKGSGIGSWAQDLSEDWDCDGGIWGSGSGRESGVGHADHGRGGLPYGGEGQRTRHQSDFRRASGDGGVWGRRANETFKTYFKDKRLYQ